MAHETNKFNGIMVRFQIFFMSYSVVDFLFPCFSDEYAKIANSFFSVEEPAAEVIKDCQK